MNTPILVTFPVTAGGLFLGIRVPPEVGGKNPSKFPDPGDVSFLVLLTVDFYYLTLSLSYMAHESANFFWKNQMANISDSVGHVVFLATI